MKQKITCFCDNTFEVEIPEEINLDSDPKHIEEILNGSFLTFPCEVCGKEHKPEFPLTIKWPAKNTDIEVLGELDRGKFYLRKDSKENAAAETVISYPEMAERIAIIKEGLVTEAVEALKYYLFVKADETYPDNEISVWYHSKTEDNLEFHIHGIKENEVAMMKVPLSLYEKTLSDFKKNPNTEPFSSMRVKSYFSMQNMLRPDVLK